MAKLILILSLLGIFSIAQEAPQNIITYEAFLDSIAGIAQSILPEKDSLDARKAAAGAETAAARDEYESTADYEKRLADFEKAKQLKIQGLEQEYQAKTKGSVDRLAAIIGGKEDFQPDWAGILQKNASAEEYRERASRLAGKTAEMKERLSQTNALLGKLEFGKGDLDKLQKAWKEKSILYIARLERAQELMQDYIIQEQSSVLTTEKKKFDMSLGAYDADRQEFEFSMNDAGSQSVPFEYVGKIKISSQQAREMNRQTDDLTASIAYINFPFVQSEAKIYPGAKKANVFYKDGEVPTEGFFKIVVPAGLDDLDGYRLWASKADSILKGTLAPRNLDSLYVRGKDVKIDFGINEKKKKEKSPSEGGFWTGRNILRISMFALSATSLGLGIAQDGDVKDKHKKANGLYVEAHLANASGSADYGDKYKAWKSQDKKVKDSESLRNGFYIGAGVFGAAGIVSFFF
ncbi:MAG: hypothetical protein FWH22_08440 [Fibromonadales bacterium]|nr:hypothetical protein [Fibromonadales bacterium]